ncbi:MAG: hypothetical protein QGG36_31970 [Pirellulaceae bacterium]|nr:hypothetical protein [Pirellulaceae bacterium]
MFSSSDLLTTDQPIPTKQPVLAESQAAEFAAWLDPQLDQLEEQFAAFVTKRSLVGSIIR